MSETVRLQIDVGNSGTKWRLLRGERVAARGVYRAEDAGSRSALLGCSDEVAGIAVASVASDETNATLAALLTERWGVKPWFAATPARGGLSMNVRQVRNSGWRIPGRQVRYR